MGMLTNFSLETIISDYEGFNKKTEEFLSKNNFSLIDFNIDDLKYLLELRNLSNINFQTILKIIFKSEIWKIVDNNFKQKFLNSMRIEFSNCSEKTNVLTSDNHYSKDEITEKEKCSLENSTQKILNQFNSHYSNDGYNLHIKNVKYNFYEILMVMTQYHFNDYKSIKKYDNLINFYNLDFLFNSKISYEVKLEKFKSFYLNKEANLKLEMNFIKNLDLQSALIPLKLIEDKISIRVENEKFMFLKDDKDNNIGLISFSKNELTTIVLNKDIQGLGIGKYIIKILKNNLGNFRVATNMNSNFEFYYICGGIPSIWNEEQVMFYF